jgi:hypothetical protein
MPQLGKGGKIVFGWSVINTDCSVKIPDMAVNEYAIAAEGNVILISGSKPTGGFCVSKKSFLSQSAFAGLFDEQPLLGVRPGPPTLHFPL